MYINFVDFSSAYCGTNQPYSVTPAHLGFDSFPVQCSFGVESSRVLIIRYQSHLSNGDFQIN